MTTQLNIDRSHTAVLIMDYQNEIIDFLAGLTSGQAELLDRAASVLAAARHARLTVIHVVVQFRDGYPEISPRNKLLSGFKATGRLKQGTQGADIHPRVGPQPGEVVVTKRRAGAFANSDMERVLKAGDITCLVLLGIATSGVVLSTVRSASEDDYEMVVIADCCADRDEEVHRVLTQKVFPTQATVVNSEEFIQALART